MKNTQRGFALLIAVIFTSVMLTFGLELASIGYKQAVLASSAIGSQYAFYVADSALECALYADQQNHGQPSLYTYPTTNPGVAPVLSCGGAGAVSSTETWSTTRWIVSSRLSLDGGKHCADVMVSKPNPSAGGTTYLFSQGYNVPCTVVTSPGGARFASRGVSARY